jgi:predicted flavoprotein YhiN
MVRAFAPDAMRAWAQDLGVPTFVGSSGRVFPVDMKAAPLLRAWLHRLRAAGVVFHMRHRWLGWSEQGALRMQGPQGPVAVDAPAVVLALGGASWARLGSDGAWQPVLREVGVVDVRVEERGADEEHRRGPTRAGRFDPRHRLVDASEGQVDGAAARLDVAVEGRDDQ